MRKFITLIAAALVLGGCGQDAAGGGGDSASAPATMPEMTFSVTEVDADLEVVMEATVEFGADGSWERTGTEPGSGTLEDDQMARIAALVEAPDFPVDPENDLACPTVLPEYAWHLDVGEERASNGNGGCSFSDSVNEIVAIVQEAAGVGPTLDHG